MDEAVGATVAVAIVVILIILAVVAVIFWKRKRDLETKYERLRNEVPMDDLDDNVILDD